MMNSYTRNFKSSGKSICIYSYNSRGFAKEKQDICKLLMSTAGSVYPVLCNQENFLLRGNGYQIKRCLPDSHVIIKEAVKCTHDAGRPKNGMFIAVPMEFKELVTDVSPNHQRVQAVVLQTKGNNILIINTYFPTDPKAENFDSSELLTTLAAIRELLERNAYNSIVWAGDLNADFKRKTTFTRIVESFLAENGLSSCWEKFPVDFTHLQERDGKSFTSVIDHCILSEEMSDSVTDAGVLHLVSNFSDHCPVYCQMPISDISLLPTKTVNYAPKPSWAKAPEEDKIKFVSLLEDFLSKVKIDESLIRCEDAHCKEESHHHACDDLLLGILKQIDKLSIQCLTPKPSHRKKKENPIAFWSEIEPFKKDAQFWHSIWISAGRPLNTELHRIMKRTRNVYHLQIRKCKKAAETLKRNALLDSCINGKGDIFTEIRKMRKAPAAVVNSVDGVTQDIPGHFASIYRQLYNSVDEQTKINSLFTTVDRQVSTIDNSEVLKITGEVVRDAVGRLKKNKTDPMLKSTSDCLSNAPPILFDHLATIFRSWLFHGHVTELLLLSTLVPIIKDKMGNLCNSDNYRSIAISSLVLKIFDWVLILLYGDKLYFDELQFGYQEQCSTNMCTWMAVETIDHFMKKGSDVFVCVMDMKKAFDTVQHSVLFNKLLERGIPATYVRLLLVMYNFFSFLFPGP